VADIIFLLVVKLIKSNSHQRLKLSVEVDTFLDILQIQRVIFPCRLGRPSVVVITAILLWINGFEIFKKTVIFVNIPFRGICKFTQLLFPFQKAVETARQKGVQVIYVRVGFSEGYPEVSPKNRMFANVAKRSGIEVAEDSMQIAEAVKPMKYEPIVTKHRVSAFAGSNLEMILRSKQIDELILCGIATRHGETNCYFVCKRRCKSCCLLI